MRFASHPNAKQMAENLDLENLEEQIEKENKVEKRIKDLSEKVRLTSEERDEQKRILEERENRIKELERENSFNSGYADMLSTHPAAKDHKDDIKAKVLSGYSIEDATFAVLGKAGKIGQPEPKPIVHENPAGGSAVNAFPSSGEKTLSQLSREEKRQKLIEAEQRGDISVT